MKYLRSVKSKTYFLWCEEPFKILKDFFTHCIFFQPFIQIYYLLLDYLTLTTWLNLTKLVIWELLQTLLLGLASYFCFCLSFHHGHSVVSITRMIFFITGQWWKFHQSFNFLDIPWCNVLIRINQSISSVMWSFLSALSSDVLNKKQGSSEMKTLWVTLVWRREWPGHFSYFSSPLHYFLLT